MYLPTYLPYKPVVECNHVISPTSVQLPITPSLESSPTTRQSMEQEAICERFAEIGNAAERGGNRRLPPPPPVAPRTYKQSATTQMDRLTPPRPSSNSYEDTVLVAQKPSGDLAACGDVFDPNIQEDPKDYDNTGGFYGAPPVKDLIKTIAAKTNLHQRPTPHVHGANARRSNENTQKPNGDLAVFGDVSDPNIQEDPEPDDDSGGFYGAPPVKDLIKTLAAKTHLQRPGMNKNLVPIFPGLSMAQPPVTRPVAAPRNKGRYA